MWYVIQTKTGYEQDLVAQMNVILPSGVCKRTLIPIFEDVRRNGGTSRISFRKLMPGYVLVDVDDPIDLIPMLRKVKEFTKLLGAEDEHNDRIFIPVEGRDIDFFDSLLENGVMSVSYVEQVRGTKIGRIIGPLAKYGNRITKLEFRKRRAVVEAEVFGKMRRIKFGLWTDEDPKIPWIERAKGEKSENNYLVSEIDIGIRPGDKVSDVTGIYGDEIFVVESVNPSQRTLRTKIRLFGGMTDIELFCDNVEKV